MRKKLFHSTTGIKDFSGKGSERLREYLKLARKRGELKGISSTDTKRFITRAKEIAKARKGKFGSDISKTEMDRIIRRIAKQTSDKINPRKAGILRKAILKR